MSERDQILQKINEARANGGASARAIAPECVRAIRRSYIAQWYTQQTSNPAEAMPIPPVNTCDEWLIIQLLEDIRNFKPECPCDDTHLFEAQIEDAVCKSYGLTEDENTYILRALNLIPQTDEERMNSSPERLECECNDESGVRRRNDGDSAETSSPSPPKRLRQDRPPPPRPRPFRRLSADATSEEEISTGGTAQAIADAGLDVRGPKIEQVADLTL